MSVNEYTHRFKLKSINTFSHTHERSVEHDDITKGSGMVKSRYRVIKIDALKMHNEEHMKLKDIVQYDGNEFGARDFVSFNIAPEPVTDKIIGVGQNSSLAKVGARNSHPKVCPRGNHILVCFGHIKALIGQSNGLLFDAHNPSMKLFGEEVREKIFQKMNSGQADTFTDDDFEIIFFEEILREVNDVWDRRLRIYERLVDSLLADSVSSTEFESEVKRIAPIKDSLKAFDISIQEAIQALKELLDSDDKMLGLLLTEQEAARKRMEIIDPKLHSAVEIVLEHYIRQLNHLSQQTNYLLMRIQSKVELVELSIDAYRNRLIQMNVNLGIAAVALASGTTIAGFFGMNVINGLEHSTSAFSVIMVGSLVVGSGIGVGCARYLSKSHSTAQARKYFSEMETMNRVLQDIDHSTVSDII